MHVLDDDRALAHRRRDAFHGTRPYVADREHAGNARAVVRSRLDEPTVVARDLRGQPLGPWLGADENEERVRGHGLDALRAAHRQALETVRTRGVDDLRALANEDVLLAADLLEEVLRHRLRERQRLGRPA